jgi:hypothetical protein
MGLNGERRMGQTEELIRIISKLEAHKGTRYQLSVQDLKIVLFFLKDYQMLINKLKGEYKDA